MKDGLRFFSHLNPLQMGLMFWMLLVAGVAYHIAQFPGILNALVFYGLVAYEGFLGVVLFDLREDR